MNKVDQRRQFTSAVSAMTSKDKATASEAICEQLMTIASVVAADTIFAYLPLEDEVDLTPLLSQWIDEVRTIAIPLVSWEENTMRAGLVTSLRETSLNTTRHGILEPFVHNPIPWDSIDVMLVPGVGFDSAGGRLGRGGGFYDRYLSISRPPVVLGIAFDEQVTDVIYREPHDQLMTAVVTPTQILLN